MDGERAFKPTPQPDYPAASLGHFFTAAYKAELVADKGYHSRDVLKNLEDGAWKSRIAERR